MRKGSSIFWGIIIIAVGILFLGNVYAWWNIDIFFDGWWTLFIIIPSIYGLLKREWISSILGIAIGVLLFLACQDYIEWNMVGKSFIPIVLITIGLSFIFKPQPKVKKTKNGMPEYVGIFSSNEAKITEECSGLSAVAVFGGIDLDLRDAKITEDIIIDCVTVFGGIDIKLPKNVKVKTSGVPIFGGIENTVDQKEGPTVYINYVCVFAAIDLK